MEFIQIFKIEKENHDFNELITKIIPKVVFEYFPIYDNGPLKDEFIMIMKILNQNILKKI